MPRAPSNSASTGKWYPTASQVKDPASVQATLKQVLDQLYTLQDQHSALQASHAALSAQVNAPAKGGPPPGCGPTDTQICGLRVSPVDTQTLANNASLKFNKSNGNFEFS